MQLSLIHIFWAFPTSARSGKKYFCRIRKKLLILHQSLVSYWKWGFLFFGEGQGDWQISESDIRYGSSHIFNLTVWPGEMCIRDRIYGVMLYQRKPTIPRLIVTRLLINYGSNVLLGSVWTVSYTHLFAKCPPHQPCERGPLRCRKILESKRCWLSVPALSSSVRLPTVSYTHLDVYKRQGQDRM